jgi:hypothetical protein
MGDLAGTGGESVASMMLIIPWFPLSEAPIETAATTAKRDRAQIKSAKRAAAADSVLPWHASKDQSGNEYLREGFESFVTQTLMYRYSGRGENGEPHY